MRPESARSRRSRLTRPAAPRVPRCPTGGHPPQEHVPRRAPVPRGTASGMTLLEGVRAHRSVKPGQRRGWDLCATLLVTPPLS